MMVQATEAIRRSSEAGMSEEGEDKSRPVHSKKQERSHGRQDTFCLFHGNPPLHLFQSLVYYIDSSKKLQMNQIQKETKT